MKRENNEYKDYWEFSDQIHKLVNDFFDKPDHGNTKSIFFVARALMFHSELLFASLEEHNDIPPELIEIAKKMFSKQARQAYGRANPRSDT